MVIYLIFWGVFVVNDFQIRFQLPKYLFYFKWN